MATKKKSPDVVLQALMLAQTAFAELRGTRNIGSVTGWQFKRQAAGKPHAYVIDEAEDLIDAAIEALSQESSASGDK